VAVDDGGHHGFAREFQDVSARGLDRTAGEPCDASACHENVDVIASGLSGSVDEPDILQ
jgi:hypothetical protein